MVDNAQEFLNITAEGLKAIQVYDSLENDTDLENQPATVKELLKRHRYPFLLPAQLEFLKNHFPPSKSMIIMASPSAGKTFLAECCVLDELQKGGRILYITPFKALNRQKYDLFARYFSEYRIIRTDGDTFPSFDTLGAANLVVATYEKALLAMLRNEPWLRSFSFTIADEITLLSDDERGPSLTFKNPDFKIDDDKLTRTLEKALRNLQQMRMLSIKRNRVTDTKWGNQISRIDWVPRDSYFAITSLKKIPRRATQETIARSLLYTVCHLGLLKRLDPTRTLDIELAYLQKSTKDGNIPLKENLRGLAVSSVLLQWMDEKPIEEIIRDSTTGSNIVHDEDIRQFGTYASVGDEGVVPGSLLRSVERLVQYVTVQKHKNMRKERLV